MAVVRTTVSNPRALSFMMNSFVPTSPRESAGKILPEGRGVNEGKVYQGGGSGELLDCAFDESHAFV
jgi:hypothetical protein